MVCPERIDRYEQNVGPFGRWTSVPRVVKDHESADSEKGYPKGDESPRAEREASTRERRKVDWRISRSLRHGREFTQEARGDHNQRKGDSTLDTGRKLKG
jgi:hypothetical protein